MLSDEEKREMLNDAQSVSRRGNFRLARRGKQEIISFDDYLFFLNNIQKVLNPFRASHYITPTKFNKL